MNTEYVPDARCKASELDPAQFVAELVRQLHDADGQPTLCRWREDWWRYDCGVYRRRSNDEIDSLIIEAVNQRAHHLTTPIVRNLRSQLSSAVLVPDAAQTPCWLGEETESRPDPRECLALPNGILHVPSRGFMPPTAAMFATAGPDYVFDPDASAPERWLRFLAEVFADEPAAISLVQEWFGYSLVARNTLQKALMMIGPPRAGKGLTCKVLSHLIGVANTINPTFASLATNFGAAGLQHATLAIINDARISGRVDVSVAVERLLTIIGGDPVTIDRKHRDSVTMQPSTRFVLAANELPQLTDASGAIATRMLLLQFRRSWLGREDSGLEAELLAELPGILLWAVEGYRRLHRTGRFTATTGGDELAQELVDLVSPVGRFVRERCEVGDRLTVSRDLLYAQYRQWAELHGYRPWTSAQFRRDLRAVCPTVHDYRPQVDDGPRPRLYSGLALRTIDLLGGSATRTIADHTPITPPI